MLDVTLYGAKLTSLRVRKMVSFCSVRYTTWNLVKGVKMISFSPLKLESYSVTFLPVKEAIVRCVTFVL